jgi:hypothetical protein
MLCPRCSKEIPLGSATCPFCLQPMLSGDPLAAAGGGLPAAPAAAPTVLKVLSVIGGIVCLLIVIFLSAILARTTHPSMDAQAIGFLVGTCIGAFLVPVIGILLYAKFNKRRHIPAYLFGATCGFALLWSFLGIVPQLAKLNTSSADQIQRRIAMLAKEGTGQAAKSRNQDEYDEILRSLFADVKKFNDDYNAEIAANDRSAPETIYSADSYKNDANISRALAHLHSALSIDEKYASIQPLIQKTKDRVAASSMSESSKEAFLKGFEGAIEKNMEPRNEVIAKERMWLSDSIDLYEFMKAHEKSFYVKNNKVLFTADDTLSTYNEKSAKVESERKDFLAAQQKFRDEQQAKLGKLGLKPSDFDAPAHK